MNRSCLWQWSVIITEAQKLRAELRTQMEGEWKEELTKKRKRQDEALNEALSEIDKRERALKEREDKFAGKEEAMKNFMAMLPTNALGNQPTG